MVDLPWGCDGELVISWFKTLSNYRKINPGPVQQLQ